MSVTITEKSMGSRELFKDLHFLMQEKEKVALIGRNGVGKSTLFGILAGLDSDFSGSIELRKGTQLIVTAQEHFLDEPTTALEYVLKNVPQYHELKDIVDNYPEQMGEDLAKIHIYSDALHDFTEKGFHTLEDRVVDSLERFDISLDMALGPLANLSGGQKRFVELTKVSFAEADLVMLDEPTNHMDYQGKARFLEWLLATKQAILVISHDRDVLEVVDRILEIKDKQVSSFPGNYSAYLRQNSTSTITQVASYEEGLKALEKLKKQINAARARKAGAGNSGPKILEERLMRQYDKLASQIAKPSFWIDQESVGELKDAEAKQYDRYKDRSIQIRTKDSREYRHELLEVRNLSVGYQSPLFQGLNITLEHGNRLLLKGRNGAGKSTLIRTLLTAIADKQPSATIYAGTITASPKLRLGLYEQEVDPSLLNLTLAQAVQESFQQKGVSLDMQKLSQLLATYLFDPVNDRNLLVRQLSGGQKARLQIISMLCNEPNLLILDEPTNHLDLPSIEELEKSLLIYTGAILYVSHDSHFIEALGGDVLPIGAA